MNNFLTLLKISLKTNLSSQQAFSTKRKAGSAALLILLICVMGFYVSMLAYQMGKSFAASGMLDMLIMFAVIGGVFFTLLNSIISSFHFIFKSKDHDMLLSLPIKTSEIFLTKMTSVLVLLYAYIAPIYIPFLTVYFIFAGVNAAMVIYAFLGFFFTPLFAFAIGLLIGMLLNSLNSLRFAKPLYIVFFLAFIVLVMTISSNPLKIMQYLSGNSGRIISVASIVYFPYYLLSTAISANNFWAFLGFIAVNVVPLAALVAVSSKYYVKLSSFFARSAKTKKFEYKESANTNVMGVLLKKELKRLISSTNYLINSCIGPLMLIIIVIVNIFTGSLSAMLNAPILAVSLLYIAFTTLLNSPLAVSISLEGETFWIYKSIPVKPSQIITAKLIMQLIIFLPLSLIGTTLLCVVFKVEALGIFMLTLYTLTINAFGAVLGMTIGLKKYNLHYTNEIQVVKQSSAVFITMLIGLLIAASIFAPYMLLGRYISEVWYVAIITVLLAIITYIMYSKLMRTTSEQFNKIN
ncbi:MAG: hypothetical protein EOM87_00085 [Clostridia bacterium]|nr:hypothetical protein [Clostridia bacterium]